MANIYVRSTDGNDADSGATWALAKASLNGAAAIDAAGDTIYLSQAHAEALSGGHTLSFAGTTTAPVRVIVANDAAEPPTATANTATLLEGGAGGLSIRGNVSMTDLPITCGNGNNFASLRICDSGTAEQHYLRCSFNLADTHPSSATTIGAAAAGETSRVEFVDCQFKIASSAQTIAMYREVNIRGGGMMAGTATAASGRGTFSIGSSQTDSRALIEGFDFSNLSSTAVLLTAGGTNSMKVVLRNCKLPASWTGTLLTGALTEPSSRVSMYDSGAYKMWIEDARGTIKDESVIVPAGSTCAYTWKMVSSSLANETASPLISDEIVLPIETGLGSAKTLTVEIIRDSATALTDAEVWVDLQYKGTAGQTLASGINDSRATLLTTAAAQTTSTKTWTTTGMSNPNKQKLEVTFTPQVAGFVHARVMLAKPSTTIYVDPEATVA